MIDISEELQEDLLKSLHRLLAEAERLYVGYPLVEKLEGVEALVEKMLARQIDALEKRMPGLSCANLQEIESQIREFLREEIARRF